MKEIKYFEFYPDLKTCSNYTLKNKKTHKQYYIRIDVFKWEQGSGLNICIMEEYDYSDGIEVYIPSIHRIVKPFIMYDRDFMEYKPIMDAILKDELKGSFLVNSVYSLFFIFFEDCLEKLEKFFPLYVGLRKSQSLEKEEVWIMKL